MVVRRPLPSTAFLRSEPTHRHFTTDVRAELLSHSDQGTTKQKKASKWRYQSIDVLPR